ncbi:IclR family transcriptional regulator [Microbacterium sp. Leaf159]|uniref:IclR family transcriptional regulator n=1 Tax=Microbacterium sp. Leaf159 TaxID=1736279 RepID=UPI0006F9C0F5|nr:IclR family transcriptional regulator [Microbacterium sp. Leaf159]KQR37455.1 hypothetical protein ASF80_17010 [Microbacterium sp. Leaf159]
MPPVTESPDSENATHRRQPLARGIELLTLIIDSDQDSHGVRELAGRMNVSPSTAHRLITDLERLGMVARTPTGTYQLGDEFLRLAWSTSAQHPLHELASRTLERLSATTGETSFFSSFSQLRARMMFTLTAESPHPLRYVIPLHEWLPLHAGASGLAILAFAPEEVRQRVIEGELEAKTDRTSVDAEELLKRLETVKSQGYCVSHGERISGAVAVAAPVFSNTRVVGSTGVSLPESRFNASQLDSLIATVVSSAEELTLGYRDDTFRFSNRSGV